MQRVLFQAKSANKHALPIRCTFRAQFSGQRRRNDHGFSKGGRRKGRRVVEHDYIITSHTCPLFRGCFASCAPNSGGRVCLILTGLRVLHGKNMHILSWLSLKRKLVGGLGGGWIVYAIVVLSCAWMHHAQGNITPVPGKCLCPSRICAWTCDTNRMCSCCKSLRVRDVRLCFTYLVEWSF